MPDQQSIVQIESEIDQWKMSYLILRGWVLKPSSDLCPAHWYREFDSGTKFIRVIGMENAWLTQRSHEAFGGL